MYAYRSTRWCIPSCLYYLCRQDVMWSTLLRETTKITIMKPEFHHSWHRINYCTVLCKWRAYLSTCSDLHTSSGRTSALTTTLIWLHIARLFKTRISRVPKSTSAAVSIALMRPFGNAVERCHITEYNTTAFLTWYVARCIPWNASIYPTPSG